MFTLWLTLVVQHKPTWHCEAITFRLKVKKIKTKNPQNTSVALTAPRIKIRLLSTKNKVPASPAFPLGLLQQLTEPDWLVCLFLLFWTLRQHSTEVQHKDYSSGQSGLKPWLHLFLAWAWTSYLTALCLHFLICKMEQIIVPQRAVCMQSTYISITCLVIIAVPSACDSLDLEKSQPPCCPQPHSFLSLHPPSRVT